MPSTKLKICGVQNALEAVKLSDLGVDLIGLNFVPTSSRHISIETALNIAAALRDSRTKLVALFQDQPITVVNDNARRLNVDFVQLHGSEDAVYLKQVIKPVIKAIPISDKTKYEDIMKFIVLHPAPYYLLDRARQGQGHSVDADIARQIVNTYPGRIYVAGGINPDNISATRDNIQPLGIDIAGGVTTANAIDFEKVKTCLSVLRS